MKSFKDFKSILDSRPAYNNPKDDADAGMDDKLKAHWKKKTIYGGDSISLKKRMRNAYARNKRQEKIHKLQSTNQWTGLESIESKDERGW